tara:strand:+ start:1154 stop:1600 length:447 start_codon:yes stop_codon:yes gene_type:complete
MISKILFINGPNLNLLGEREQSQYGSVSFDDLKKKCMEKSKNLSIELDFIHSNIEGEIINMIQNANTKYDGIIINAAGFTHTSVAIRDALEIYKKPKIEVHISNIYSREEFRHKSLISSVVNGGIFGLGVEGYNLAILAMNNLLNENK